MIDENKLIDALHRWDMQDLYLPCHFEMLVDEQQKVNKWIPCSEKLPYYDEPVLVTDDCYRVFIAMYSVTHGWCSFRYGGFNVVAWMPLPEPYE